MALLDPTHAVEDIDDACPHDPCAKRGRRWHFPAIRNRPPEWGEALSTHQLRPKSGLTVSTGGDLASPVYRHSDVAEVQYGMNRARSRRRFPTAGYSSFVDIGVRDRV
jgi:hypothetical protein